MNRRHFISLLLPVILAACNNAAPFAPATDRLTFIYFYAGPDLCEMCPQMQPVVDAVRAVYQDRVAFANLDAAANAPLMQRYGLTGYPSYVLLRKDGNVAWSFLGARTQAQFAAEIEKALATP